MPKSPRRLELRLPSNHPVWDLPDGFRSKIAREWLELGRRLASIEDDLKDIKELINSSEPSISKGNTIVSNDNETQQEFDKNAFLSHFK